MTSAEPGKDHTNSEGMVVVVNELLGTEVL